MDRRPLRQGLRPAVFRETVSTEKESRGQVTDIYGSACHILRAFLVYIFNLFYFGELTDVYNCTPVHVI
jgi:hypothetical protein